MPSNTSKEDKRKLKTQRSLNMAMFSLLKKYNFRKITIENICDEALTGRATFYAHFADKYDLLKFWLLSFFQHGISKDDAYKDIEKKVNRFIHKNETIIINIVDSADDKTLRALIDFICSVLSISDKQHPDGKLNQKYIVASNIYIGGIVNYLVWQVENRFPSDVPMMNKEFYALIKMFQEWDENNGGLVNE